jgi:hypothetical protein
MLSFEIVEVNPVIDEHNRTRPGRGIGAVGVRKEDSRGI